jgi:hypothetical protein
MSLPSVSADEISAAMARFDDELLRRSSPWANWETNQSHHFAIRKEHKLYPVKQIIAMATGAAVSSFSGGSEANDYLKERGFEIEPLHPPTEVETRFELSAQTLDPSIEKSLRNAHEEQVRRGELLSTDRIRASYAAFRARFGPDSLKPLDGPALLHAMHAHGNKESLVYWLEFKNDDEFPGPAFGSISGDSAHKFGLFRRRETDQWVEGSSNNEKNVSEADAVIVARRHRDQLLSGVSLLESLPTGSDDAAYLALQEALKQQASDICGLAWAHKYWSLLFPEKLDDFHSERWQRHNLLRLLETPPVHDGLYVCAGRFVRARREDGLADEPPHQRTQQTERRACALLARRHSPRRWAVHLAGDARWGICSHRLGITRRFVQHRR